MIRLTILLQLALVLAGCQTPHTGVATLSAAAATLYPACAGCHGDQGQGNEALDAPRIATQDLVYLKRQLQAFRSGERGVHGAHNCGAQMALMASTITDDGALSALVELIAALPDTPAATTLDGDIENGARLYRGCAACHGAAGEGIPVRGAPRLAGIDDWYLLRQLRYYRDGVRGATGDPASRLMAAQATGLQGDQDLIDVLSYIASLSLH